MQLLSEPEVTFGLKLGPNSDQETDLSPTVSYKSKFNYTKSRLNKINVSSLIHLPTLLDTLMIVSSSWRGRGLVGFSSVVGQKFV